MRVGPFAACALLVALGAGPPASFDASAGASGRNTQAKAPAAGSPASFDAARARMVRSQIAGRGIRDAAVLAAMGEVPRHLFVPPRVQPLAYEDSALPIGHDQTISQPYIVALMTELARPRKTDRAFEVGTGSGYQAAVISRLVERVYTIEIIEPLAREAERRLASLGYRNVSVRAGDGYNGWPDAAPFDIILVTAAPDHVPAPLVQQLKAGGRLVLPVGPEGDVQKLQVIEKDARGKTSTRTIIPVRFVPLTRRPQPQ